MTRPRFSALCILGLSSLMVLTACFGPPGPSPTTSSASPSATAGPTSTAGTTASATTSAPAASTTAAPPSSAPASPPATQEPVPSGLPEQTGPLAIYYVAVGDNARGAIAQFLNSRLGKILRINADGTIPADNPLVGATSGPNQAIWAYGLRNAFTFAFRPTTGTMYINDTGNAFRGIAKACAFGLQPLPIPVPPPYSYTAQSVGDGGAALVARLTSGDPNNQGRAGWVAVR